MAFERQQPNSQFVETAPPPPADTQCSSCGVRILIDHPCTVHGRGGTDIRCNSMDCNQGLILAQSGIWDGTRVILNS